MKIDLNSLDFSDIGGWPMPAKVGAIAGICAFVLFAGIWFDTLGQWDELKKLRVKEADLKQTYETKQAKAINLETYKKQMHEVKQSLGTLLRQLPGKTEVDGLLEDISQTGIASGLEFDLFKPDKEIPVEFYVELPIKIKVTGNYHDFGNFVSAVATMPRIVTLQDITVVPAQSASTNSRGSKETKSSKGLLVMEATAKTYRYMGEDTP